MTLAILPQPYSDQSGDIVKVKPGRQNHSAHIQLNRSVRLFEIDRFSLADLYALVTFRTNPAGYAPLGLRQNLGFGKTQLDFGEVFAPPGRLQPRHPVAGNAVIPVGGYVLRRVPLGVAIFAKVNAADKPMDGNGRLFAGFNGFDDRFRPTDGIARLQKYPDHRSAT